MADILTSEDWDPGEQVTDTKMDNILGSAVIQPLFVTSKTELLTPVGTEELPVVEAGGGYKRLKLQNIPGASTQPNPTYVVLTDAATVIQTCVANKVYQNAKLTIGGNRTLQINSVANGMFGVIIVTQDATGGRTLTLPANSFGLGHTGAITLADLDGTPASVTICSWTYDGANYYWTFAKYDIITSYTRAFTGVVLPLTTGVTTALALDSETNDNDGMHSLVTNNSRLTVQNPGIYQINTYVSFVSNATGERYVAIRLNGATVLASVRKAAATTSETTVSVTWPAVVGDYFETTAMQASGGTINVSGCIMSAHRIGPTS